MSDRRLIAGVDLSTREIHLVRRLQGTTSAEWRRINLESYAKFAERDALSARATGRAMQEDLSWWDDVWLAGVEYPFTMTMGSVGLKTVMGAIMATIPEHVHVIPLPARLWTPEFLRLPGEALPKVPRKSADRKPLIKARAQQLLRNERSELWPQDVFDAFGLSWAVEALNKPALDPLPLAKVAR